MAFDGEDLVLTGDDLELRFHPVPPILTSPLAGTDWVLETLLDGETASSVPGDADAAARPTTVRSRRATGCRDVHRHWRPEAAGWSSCR